MMQRHYYVLGFGLGGKSQIASEMFLRYDVSPKVLIINADPFFSGEHNNTLERVLENTDSTQWEHKIKKLLQKHQSEICQRTKPDSFVSSYFCVGEVPTLFRSRDTGFWLTNYYGTDNSIPVTWDKSPIGPVEHKVKLLDEFISLSGVARECIILTITPRTGTEQNLASALAQEASLPAFFPQLDGLVTIDDSHLSKSSAERWSAGFLTDADATIQRCLEPLRTTEKQPATPAR